MNNVFQVNYLLSMSRLPDHFYAEVNGLTGKDATYNNPGVSLRSFVVAKCISRELVVLTPEMTEILDECVKFSTSASTIAKIVEMLLLKTSAIMEKIIGLDQDLKTHFVRQASELNELSESTKKMFDTVMKNHGAESDVIDSDEVLLRDSLFELSEMISDTEYFLEKFIKTSPVPA